MGDSSMIEELYSKPDLTKKVRFHAKAQKTTEEDDTHATIYDNYVVERTTRDMVQDVVQDVVQEQQQTAASAPSGVNLKVAAVLLSLLFIVSVAAVVVTATISLHNGSQNEEFLRRLGHMTENLSQQLMTNNRNLSKKFDLLTAVVDAVASTLNATSHNISRRMDGLAEAIGKGPCPPDWTWFITSCYLKSTSPKNWEDGRTFCQERGGDLVVVSNRREQSCDITANTCTYTLTRVLTVCVTAASAPSGVNLKVAAVLLSLLFIVSVAAVVVTATISLHNGSQNEEFLRRLGHMTENLSQQLMTNNRNLSKKFDLLTAVVDAVASTLNATSHNISRRMDGLAEAIGKGPCPPDWTWFITSCYLKSTSPKNWEDGRTFCQERGGDLVVVSNRREQLFIMSFDVNVWIGVRAEGFPRVWKGVNNVSVRTTFWASGEPNNSWRKVNCVEVLKKSSVDNWNDENCSLVKDFICEQHVAL